MFRGPAAIVLAAGASQRMGTPKALLAWRGSTLLDYAIDQARSAGVTNVVVVLGPATRHLQLDTLTVVNPDPETGRSTSIRLGATALPDDVDSILVQSVDQPVPASVLDALVAARAEVAVPTYQGRRGHPVCFGGPLLRELRQVSEVDQGLRAVVRRHTVTEVPVDSESVVWNLNDPGAYAMAVAQQ
jgi:molybdenum cofactor cytidylyltransferase